MHRLACPLPARPLRPREGRFDGLLPDLLLLLVLSLLFGNERGASLVEELVALMGHLAVFFGFIGGQRRRALNVELVDAPLQIDDGVHFPYRLLIRLTPVSP